MSWDIFSKSKIQYFLEKLKGKFVQKETGKGLSSNDYTTTDKNKVALIDNTTTSATGNPISIADLKSAQIALNPVITFEPIQAGSGTPSPSNIRAISGYDKIEVLGCQKNIAYKRLAGSTINGSGVVSSFSGYDLILAHVKSGTTYVISGISDTFKLYGFFITEPTIGSVTYNNSRVAESGSVTGYSFTAPISGWIAFRTVNTATQVQCEEGSTATTYVPSNKTTDLSESLGQTVYYGRLDVRTGEFTVLGKAVDMGNLVYTYYQSSDFFYVSSTSMPDVASEVSPSNSWCEIYPIISVTQSNPYILWNGTQLRIYYTGYTDAATFKNAMTGYKLVYPISNPFTIQLTPHEIALSQGYNYISTNGTSISLAYHNGELASLNDVETLGQTVENVVGYLEANNRGTAVNLKPYTSAEPYQFPNDGYVIVYGGSATSGRINVALRGNDGGNFGGIIMNVTSATQMQTTFVRKGMKAYFIADTTGATDDVIEYRALTL